jgi:hypothetical protein
MGKREKEEGKRKKESRNRNRVSGGNRNRIRHRELQSRNHGILSETRRMGEDEVSLHYHTLSSVFFMH